MEICTAMSLELPLLSLCTALLVTTVTCDDIMTWAITFGGNSYLKSYRVYAHGSVLSIVSHAASSK